MPGGLLIAASAAAAAGMTALAIRRIATASGRAAVATMLLAGLVLSACLAALTALVVAGGRVPEMGSLAFWSLGSFSGVVGADVLIAAITILPLLLVLAWLGPRMDALALGEREAGHLGVDVRRTGLLLEGSWRC